MARYAPAAYTGAQTDTVIVSVASGQLFVLRGYEVFVHGACSVNVSFSLEFDDTADVLIGGHPGLRPGSGVVSRAPAGDSLAEGADGQDLIFTCSAPTGGSVTLAINGDLVSTT